jgi:hypothetical protein
VFVQTGRIGLAALQHLVHDILLVVFKLNRGSHVFGLGAGWRNTHGHQFAHETHLAFGQGRLLGRTKTFQGRVGNNGLYAILAKIGGSKNLLAQWLGHMNIEQLGMCNRAAHKSHVLHVGQLYVCDILPFTPHVTVVFFAKNTFTDTLIRHFNLL